MNFEEACKWTENLLSMLSPVASWGVPRAETIYQIDQPNKCLTRTIGDGDEAIEDVFKHLGYEVKT